MSKLPPLHYNKLKSFKINNYSQKSLFFNKNEEQISDQYPLILAETWKYYYYIDLSYDKENTEWFGTEIIYCMEKSAMRKFIDVKKIRRLKALYIVKIWIRNLSVLQPPNDLDSVWLLGPMFPYCLPYCSVLEVHYDEQRGCLLPDLVFCHPKIWDKYKTNLDKNEIIRLEEKFEFHFENSVKDPSNSAIIRLQKDLKALLPYLKDLKKELEEQKNKEDNEPRRKEAEQRRWEAEQRKKEAEQRRKEAEQRRWEAEQRRKEAEQRRWEEKRDEEEEEWWRSQEEK